MRILDENILKTATVSGTNPDPNYPIANLYDNTLRSLYRSTTSSTTITVSLDSPKAISYFAIGNHNASSVRVKLKLGTDTIADNTYTDHGNYRKYYTSYVDGDRILTESADGILTESGDTLVIDGSPLDYIDGIEIIITSSDSYVSVGNISVGSFLQFPSPNINPTIGRRLTGSFAKTESGILTGKTGVALESFGVTFDAVSLTFVGDFNNAFDSLQNNTAFWIDRYEDSTDDYPILFVNCTNADYSATKEKAGTRIDGLLLNFEECK